MNWCTSYRPHNEIIKYVLLAICNFLLVCDFTIDWNGRIIVNLCIYTIYVHKRDENYLAGTELILDIFSVSVYNSLQKNEKV